MVSCLQELRAQWCQPGIHMIAINRITAFGNYRQVTEVGLNALRRSFREKGLLEDQPMLLWPRPEEAWSIDGALEYECVEGNHRLTVLRTGWDDESKAHRVLDRQWPCILLKVMVSPLPSHGLSCITKPQMPILCSCSLRLRRKYGRHLPRTPTICTMKLRSMQLHGRSSLRLPIS